MPGNLTGHIRVESKLRIKSLLFDIPPWFLVGKIAFSWSSFALIDTGLTSEFSTNLYKYDRRTIVDWSMSEWGISWGRVKICTRAEFNQKYRFAHLRLHMQMSNRENGPVRGFDLKSYFPDYRPSKLITLPSKVTKIHLFGHKQTTRNFMEKPP